MWQYHADLFVCTALLLLAVSVSSYDVKAWQSIGPDTDLLPFPEYSLPEVKSRPNVGLSLSGGGDRAFAASIGYLGAFHELGLMDSVRYLVGVSGGSWAATVYSYYQKGNVSDSTMLGEIVFPANISYEGLKLIDPDCVRSYTNSSYILQGPEFEDWADAVEAIYLAPSGIERGVGYSYNKDSVADIKSRNPDLSSFEFYVLRGNGDGDTADIDPRPFPIISTTLIGPFDMLPFTPVNRNYTLIEWTPLSVGVAYSNNVTYITDDESETREVTVGGLLEPFAFSGANAPSVGLPVGQTTGNLSIPPSTVECDLALTSGSSSWAVGCSVAASSSVPLQQTSGLVNYFSPSARNPSDMFESYVIADGAGVSNTNLISLLQRNVSTIVAFVTTSVPMYNSTHWDPATDVLTEDYIDFTVPAWFGHIAEGLGVISNTSFDLENSQVFDSDEWVPMAKALQAAQATGNGIVVSLNHTTVRNDKYGIQPGRLVNVIWVYLGRCFTWESELSEEMQDLVVPLNDPQNQASIKAIGPFASFPHYTTALAHTNIERANLLADLAGWTIYKNVDIFKAAFNVDSEPDDDDDDKSSSNNHGGDDDKSFVDSTTGIVVVVISAAAVAVVLAVSSILYIKKNSYKPSAASIERQSEMTNPISVNA